MMRKRVQAWEISTLVGRARGLERMIIREEYWRERSLRDKHDKIYLQKALETVDGGIYRNQAEDRVDDGSDRTTDVGSNTNQKISI